MPTESPAPDRGLIAYALALLLDAAMVAWAFPPRLILGTYAFAATGDAVQHIIGRPGPG